MNRARRCLTSVTEPKSEHRIPYMTHMTQIMQTGQQLSHRDIVYQVYQVIVYQVLI